jgi:adenylosuccinate synthase
MLKKMIVEKAYSQNFDLDEDKIFSEYSLLASRLEKYLGDVSQIVHGGMKDKKIIFESAQGTFLDITYGTYPYVTSSHPITGSVFSDVGIPPQRLSSVAIVKAYTTRVGSGPFLTELHDSLGEDIRKKGNEFGTTTGRPRRCGWLDLVMLKYASRLNGFSSLAITKLDVLSGIKKLKIAVKYSFEGKEANFPLTIEQLEKCIPEYIEFDGFSVSSNIKKYSDLDKNAKKYLEFIESYLGVPISLISVGPGREETIVRNEIKY